MLLIPRGHCETLAELGVEEGAAVGVWLGVMGRGVLRAVWGGGGGEGEQGGRGAWNVVQANGE
jgi:hypothetical protein